MPQHLQQPHINTLPLPLALKNGWKRVSDNNHLLGHAALNKHVLCIGYGVNGEAVLHAAKMAGIAAVAIEMNPEIVRKARSNGDLVVYGDATQDAVLEEEGVRTAKVVFIAISDPVSTRRIVASVRALNSAAHIIVRTRLVSEIQELYALGAEEVVADEFESAVESFSRVMRRYLVPKSEIANFTAEFRARGYEMIRTHQQNSSKLSELPDLVPDVDMLTMRVQKNSAAEGKTLAELSLRPLYGVTLLALRRKEETIVNPQGAIDGTQ